MKLPLLSNGVRYDKQRTVAAEASVRPSRDWWACARCAVKVPGCYGVCQVDPTGVGCVTCLGSAGEDCNNCFR